MIRRHHLILIFLLVNFSLVAQETSPTQRYLEQPISERPFDQESWNVAKEGIDFRDEMRVDRYDEDFSDEEETANRTNREERNSNGGSSVLGFIFKLLMVVGAVLLIGFLISQFLGGGGITLRRNRKIDNSPLEVSLEKIEEELLESDVDRMLRLALEAKNYPLALRLKYLAIIKSLYLNGYTRWKKDKTNRQYIREITEVDRKEEFRKLTLTYERVWYGRSEINKQEFDLIEPEFSSFIKKIEANPKKEFELV